ncbi:MAG TPA: universal stress protein [Puia sp.]|nr:universal stress protein [Puia sp.]
MKKVIFVCDGNNFSNGSFEFLKMLNENDSISVKGIFFDPIDFMQLIALSYNPSAEPFIKVKEEEKLSVKKSEEIFKDRCKAAGIRFTIHEEKSEWLADLFARETRFADLTIVSAQMFASEISDVEPNTFMAEALRIAECPIILVPETFKTIDRVIIAYDGKEESLFALKQFCNIMPRLTEMPTELVYIKEEDDDAIPDSELIKEYARLHFESLGVAKLHFDAKKFFSSWTAEKKNVLLVCGSYGRTAVSNLLKASFAENIIRDHLMPVFVAHNN